jgi:UDP-N-acetylglucosamine 2-epimerase
LAERNLLEEKVMGEVVLVGDTMLDVFLKLKPSIESMRDEVVGKYTQQQDRFVLITLHRREVVDNIDLLGSILTQLNNIGREVIFPIHPRTRKNIEKSSFEVTKLENIQLLDPLIYTEFHSLLSKSSLVLTDSGGLQKEAYFWNVPCITIRDTKTSWPETLENDANILLHPEDKTIVETAEKQIGRDLNTDLSVFGNGTDLSVFGNGNASELVVEKMLEEELKLPIR